MTSSESVRSVESMRQERGVLSPIAIKVANQHGAALAV
jgi:hypothetical protein